MESGQTSRPTSGSSVDDGQIMSDKPLPWEDAPYVDPKAATERAIAVAQAPAHVDPDNPAVKAYAQKAFNDEMALVRSPPAGYNDQLFKSAANLYELVAAGALDEYRVETALRDAMRDNGYERDKGENAVINTIKSARRKGFDNPRDLSRVGTKKRTNGHVIDDAPVQTIEFTSIFTLEQGFWTARESLQNIYLGALAMMCSPWAVLANCVARALATVRPNATLPALTGGPGSLNWFAAVAASSGGGKSAATDAAEQLVTDYVRKRNLGSGEGLVDSYIKPANKELGEPAGLYESVMFYADEVDSFAALLRRPGSTLGPTLREAFMGRMLGFSYRTSSDLHLERHTYRLTLVINVQPGRAGALLDDKQGGTLQRFMWFPGKDTRVSAQKPPMPAPLDIASQSCWLYPRELKIPYEARALIDDKRERDNQSEFDNVEGHELFIREKFAFGLAVLDGRDEMTSEDWRLAGIAMRVSDRTREWVEYRLRESAEEEAAEQGRVKGIQQQAADEEKTHRVATRMIRIKTRVFEKIKATGSKGLTKGELNHVIAYRDRPYLQPAIDALRRDALITQVDDKFAERWMTIDEA